MPNDNIIAGILYVIGAICIIVYWIVIYRMAKERSDNIDKWQKDLSDRKKMLNEK